jgi:rare lipoprotein A
MGLRFRALPTALLLTTLALASCAKKHRATGALPAPPQIQSVETGLASWYGHPYHGRPAANGEIYDMESFTAAHRTLPFGTRVRVTNLANQKTVDVRINDRGPFIDGRIIDLSHAAAEAIDLIGPGVAQVRLDILSAPELPPADSLFAVQAGAFLDKSRAERLRASLDREYGPARLVIGAGSPSLWRVLVGSEPTEDAAKALASRIRQEVGNAFVVRLDSPGAAANAQNETSANP